jgi:hypothetical protein
MLCYYFSNQYAKVLACLQACSQSSCFRLIEMVGIKSRTSYCQIWYNWCHYWHQGNGGPSKIYSPIIIPNAFASGSSTIIGNTSNKHTEPSFVYSDASEIGLIMVVVTYDDIPLELCLEEHLSLKTVADTSWVSAKVKLGMVQTPMFAPIFFGQKTIVSSVHQPDFEDQLGGISPVHH